MAQTILLFEIKKEKRSIIKHICRKLGIEMREIRPIDYGQSLGYLAHIEGFARQKGNHNGGAFPEEMLVFSGMNSDHLDRFLDSCREMNMDPIGLKAVLTPHNVWWTAEHLFQEIRREHQEFSK